MTLSAKEIVLPASKHIFEALKAGDRATLTGTIYVMRDQAHQRIYALIKRRRFSLLPFSLKGQIVYYTGPAPAKPGKIIGPAGPTTSERMDAFTPLLLQRGMTGMIGKGPRSKEVVEAIRLNRAVYFTVQGGISAFLAGCIEKNELIAYPELGAEAVRRLFVRDFPVTVAIDSNGRSLF